MDNTPYTVKEFSGLMGISLNSAYEVIHSGQLGLPFFRVGAKILLPRPPVDKMLAGDAGALEA